MQNPHQNILIDTWNLLIRIQNILWSFQTTRLKIQANFWEKYILKWNHCKNIDNKIFNEAHRVIVKTLQFSGNLIVQGNLVLSHEKLVLNPLLTSVN